MPCTPLCPQGGWGPGPPCPALFATLFRRQTTKHCTHRPASACLSASMCTFPHKTQHTTTQHSTRRGVLHLVKAVGLWSAPHTTILQSCVTRRVPNRQQHTEVTGLRTRLPCCAAAVAHTHKLTEKKERRQKERRRRPQQHKTTLTPTLSLQHTAESLRSSSRLTALCAATPRTRNSTHTHTK